MTSRCISNVMTNFLMSWLFYAMTYVLTPMSKKFRHDIENTSWHKKFIMTPKTSSWRQKYVMISKVLHDIKKVLHDVKNAPWRQKRHDGKMFVMTLNVMMSWRHDVKKNRHDIKNTSWRQKYAMTSKSSSDMTSKLRERFVMTSKYRHNVKKYAMT